MAQKRTAKQGNSQQHSQQSFQQQVASAVNQKLLGAVDQRINQLAMFLHKQSQSNFEDVYARLQALEDILSEKFGLTENDFAFKVAEVQDRAEGLITTNIVDKGDTVRLELSTRTKEQTEYQGTTRAQLTNAGAGTTYGPEIESAIIGMAVGETKEIEFGQDKQMMVKLTVQRVSRKPAAAATAEENNESNNA